MTTGVIVGFIAEILIIAILSGINIFGSGISDVSVKAIAIVGTMINILFSMQINPQISIGLGLLYPVAYNIFVVTDMGLLGYIGFIFITGLSVLAIVSGILIAFSGASVD
jgi:hypothetical protein